MDLQREKSELIDSNGLKVSRLQTQLQEQNRSNENKDDEVSLFNTEFKIWEGEQYSKANKNDNNNTKLNIQIIQLAQKLNQIQNPRSCTDKIVNSKNKIAAQQSEKLGETN